MKILGRRIIIKLKMRKTYLIGLQVRDQNQSLIGILATVDKTFLEIKVEDL